MDPNRLSVCGDVRARGFAIPTPEHAPAIKDKRFPALDGLRGLAILMVMLYHSGAKLDAHAPLQNLFRGPFRTFGWTGVDLFFVLSGFLITGILLDTRAAANYFSMFYARRVLRILPLYYAALLVIWFVPAFNANAPLRALPWYAIFAQNWRALKVPPAGDFWSLGDRGAVLLGVAIGCVCACSAQRLARRESRASSPAAPCGSRISRVMGHRASSTRTRSRAPMPCCGAGVRPASCETHPG